jgi:hypothetical protein
MRNKLSIVAAVGCVALVAAVTTGNAAPKPRRATSGSAIKTLVELAEGKRVKIPRLPNGLLVPMPSGGMNASVRELVADRTGDESGSGGLLPDISTYGCRHVFSANGHPDNVRANVDCGFRFQSEEWVAVNPTDPENIVVSQNDSKFKGNRTAVDFSLNGGRNFGDSELPNGRVNVPEDVGSEWSFDAFSDPVHAFDSRGNLYYSAVGFDAFQDFFGGLFVWKSNYCLKGSALHTPGSGSCDPFEAPILGTAIPVRLNFDNPNLSDDKEMLAADYYESSPFRDNVYITWTIFDFSCGEEGGEYCESPIFFSRSSDGGVHWSEPLEISGSNPKLCRFGNLFNPDEDPNACNFSQGSYPVVGPDGTIYVVFNNANSSVEAAAAGVAQQLFVKSTDGGQHWTQPVKVGDDFATQPISIPPDNEIPDCPPLRQCLPPNGYRINDYPSLGIDDGTGKLAAFWADFRNGGPCAENEDLGVAVPVEPCRNHNNDVFTAVSTDGGTTWSRERKVAVPGISAQWQPWGDVGENGSLYVAYYDRRYDGCERIGCNDITLSRSRDDGRSWSHQRITTSSMPNLTCEDNPEECGFLGDYMGTRYWLGTVHLVWGDTRGRGLGFPEEDVYYARVGS